MPRYESTKITSDKKGRSKYDTTVYKKNVASNSDILVITQEGDRLDNLAQQYYGDPSLWWFIARANNLKTMNVEAGVQMRIPVSTSDAFGN